MENTSDIKHTRDAMNDLLNNYQLFKGGEISQARMKEINNTHGKMDGKLKVELLYKALTRHNEPIPFLEDSLQNPRKQIGK